MRPVNCSISVRSSGLSSFSSAAMLFSYSAGGRNRTATGCMKKSPRSRCATCTYGATRLSQRVGYSRSLESRSRMNAVAAAIASITRIATRTTQIGMSEEGFTGGVMADCGAGWSPRSLTRGG